MSKISGSASVFLVADVVKAANYYRDHMGFTYERFWGEPPCFCILNRDYFSIMLSQVEDPQKVQPNSKMVDTMWSTYFWVTDVEAEYKRMVSLGANVLGEVQLKEHGCKEFEVKDLDGYVIAFGECVD